MKRFTKALLTSCIVISAPMTTFADVSPNQQSNEPSVHTFPLPSQGFDPLAASNTDLIRYGFPQKPSDPSDLAAWTNAMQHFKKMITPTFVNSGIKKVLPEAQTVDSESGSTTAYSG